MKRKAEEQLQLQTRRKNYRDEHKESEARRFTAMRRAIQQGNMPTIGGILEKPEDVDMENFVGSEDELEWMVERLFANDGL